MYTAETVSSRFAPPRLPVRKYLQVGIIALIGFAISVGVMNLLNSSLQTRRQMEFDKAVNSVVSRLEQGAATYENVLRNLDALYRNSVQVVRDVFELYSTVPAESNPAIRSIGYASIVRANELGEFTFMLAQNDTTTTQSILQASAQNMCRFSTLYPIPSGET